MKTTQKALTARIIVLVVVLTSILILPVKAESADIEFHVGVIGKDTFYPGEEATLTLSIENSATLNNFLLNQNTSESLPVLTTAYDVRVELSPSYYAPISVKDLNPKVLGNLPAGVVARTMFRIEVFKNASEGTYRIPVRIRFNKIVYSPTQSGLVISYSEEVETEYVKIKIEKRDYDFAVESIRAKLTAGSEGIVELSIKNVGKKEMKNIAVYLNCTPPLKPNPKASFAYIPDLKPDQIAKVRFRVFVMNSAFNGSYPAKLILSFLTESDTPMVLRKTIGLNVKSETNFDLKVIKSLITSAKSISRETMPTRGFIELRIKNEGEDISDAYAVMGFNTPLLKAVNTPYIGDLKHNESVDLLFYVKSFAPAGNYMGYIVVKFKKFGDEIASPKLYFSVVVRDEPAIRIEEVKTQNLGVGMSGEIDLKLADNATNLKLDLVSEDPTIKVITPSAFVDSSTARFRVRVSGEALPGLHNFYLIERFDFGEAKDLISIAEFSVEIQPKLAYFQIVSIKSVGLYPDSTGDVIVKIKNAGNTTIYNAVVMLEVSQPLSIAGSSSIASFIGRTQSGTYFVGTLKPNEIATAKFKVTVNKKAGAGFYPVSIRIKYYDGEGYAHLSDPLTASVEVKERPLITPITVTAIALASIAIGLAVRFAKTKKK